MVDTQLADQTTEASAQTEYTKLVAKAGELSSEQKACLGSMLGAFIGDSVGSYREFKQGDCPPDLIEESMQMPGGGCWRLMPGQVTDDSELAMCMLRGLVAGKGKFDLFHHALYYGHWHFYGPFDIGNTTANGLGPLRNCLSSPNPGLAHAAAKTGPGFTSLSNGSLMRITPMAVWARNLIVEELEQCVEADVSMMHSKKEMWQIVTAYCITIKVLLKNPDDENRANLALQAVREYANRNHTTSLVNEWLTKAEQLSFMSREMANQTQEEFYGNRVYNAIANMGYVRHAFILAFYSLYRASDKSVHEIYDFAMRQTVKLQGDTDTNCAIVGGLIGAYVGIDHIDAVKIKKVLECRLLQSHAYRGPSARRPKFIMPGEGCIDEMLELIHISPSSLEMVTEYVDQGLTIE